MKPVPAFDWFHLFYSVINCVWAGFLLLMLGSAISADAQQENSSVKLDLTGTIRDLANHPISNATVSIYAAWPKDAAWAKDSGVSVVNRFTDDCGKCATTDANGRFTIKALATNTLFQILIVAKGFRPEFLYRVDPSAEPPDVTNIVIHPLSSGTLPEEQVHGRVLDSDGKPVSGAVVSVYGVHDAIEWRSTTGSNVDSMAVTDDSGEFVIRSQTNFIACDLNIEATGFAPGDVHAEVPTGDTTHEFRLTKGASLKGRLLKDGKPVVRAEMGIACVGAVGYNRVFSLETDDQGHFSFVNIPSDTDYYLYGIMSSLKDKGGLDLRHVYTGADGSVQDLGDLELKPAFTVSGTVRLSNGKPAPAGCLVTLCRTVMTPPPDGEYPRSEDSNRGFYRLEDDLDGWELRGIGKQGQFQFSGVPAGPVSIFIMVPGGIHVSPHNVSADIVGWRLLGRVVTNKTDLVFEMEPGQKPENTVPVDYQALSEKPLRGAE